MAEIHAAAKETVALAEQRFMSNSHEWQFDNAWQEMLNHATQKVMDAEKQKAECHVEHQRCTTIFHAAEQKVQQLEDRFRRSIMRARPYFEEKQICQDQLQTQKNRITELQQHVQQAKSTYATSLRNLERISDDIHRQRGDYPHELSDVPPPGPREPGVGAELNSPTSTTLPSLPDFEIELGKCDFPSLAGSRASLGGTSQRSSDILSCHTTAEVDAEADDEGESMDFNNKMFDVTSIDAENDVEALRQKMKILAVRPIEGGDGQQQQNDTWEHELTATVNKLDHLMMLNERAIKQQQQQQKHQQQQRPDLLGAEAKQPTIELSLATHDSDDDDVMLCQTTNTLDGAVKPIVAAINSLPATPQHNSNLLQPPTPIKQLQKLAPLPSVNVSMRELPLLARLSHEVLDRAAAFSNKRRRSLD